MRIYSLDDMRCDEDHDFAMPMVGRAVFEQFADEPRPAEKIPRNDEQEKRNEPPFRKRMHGQAAEITAAAPERIQPEVHPARLQRDDLALEKRLRRFGKRREQQGDGGRGGQGGRADYPNAIVEFREAGNAAWQR